MTRLAMPDLDTGTFNAPVSDALAEFMQRGWGPLPESSGPPAPPAQLAAARRSRLREALPDQRIVVRAGQPARRNGDQFHPFRADSDYVWLTGDQSADGVVVLDPGAEPILYLHPPSSRADGEFWRNTSHGELWVGRRPSLEARSADLGIECRPRAELAEDPGAGDQQLVRAVLSELRLVKDAWELAQLRSAVDTSVRGFGDVARLLRSGSDLNERAVETTFDARARREGHGLGYHTISAVGEHAATLHWNRNDTPLRAGQLLLLDAGAETGSLYTADITRTIPVSGTFTPLQRAVYEIVFAAQEAGLKLVRPGEQFKAFYAECARVLAEGLADLGVLPIDPVESVQADSGLHRRWTLCSPGHMLGLDVHDCGNSRAAEYLDGVLEAGQVLTVEPGLYFQANDELVPEALRGLGVRIEDDVLVTAEGCEVLSSGLPRTVEDIEAWLAGPDDLNSTPDPKVSAQ